MNKNIDEFKKALKAGEVCFTYKKKDGTLRKARGTLCKDLVPKSEPVIKYSCTDIVWDRTNDPLPAVKLPKRMTVAVAESLAKDMTTEELERHIINELNSKIGWKVETCEYREAEKREPKKLAEGVVFYYDLDKQDFRSFNESQFVVFCTEKCEEFCGD